MKILELGTKDNIIDQINNEPFSSSKLDKIKYEVGVAYNRAYFFLGLIYLEDNGKLYNLEKAIKNF